MDKLSERLEFVAKDADFHGFHGNAALLREAAQLARRVEEAPVVPVRISDGYYVINLPYELIGKIGDRFLLVREK